MPGIHSRSQGQCGATGGVRVEKAASAQRGNQRDGNAKRKRKGKEKEETKKKEKKRIELIFLLGGGAVGDEILAGLREGCGRCGPCRSCLCRSPECPKVSGWVVKDAKGWRGE